MKNQDVPFFIKNNIMNEFLYVQDYPQYKLMELANYIFSLSDKWHKIYWLQGSIRGEYYPSFKSIKLNPRLVLKDGQLYTETGGLIFPQDKPIILVLEDFNLMEPRDQYAFSNIFNRDTSGIDYYLHPESLVIARVSGGSRLDISNVSRWIEFKDDN